MILFTAGNIKSHLINSLRLKLEEAGNRIMFIKNSLARKALSMRTTDANKKGSQIYDL